jgi:F-type H+-transporting ATPase subunit gamma
MAGIRQIFQHRKAVESIRRITRTMEMISIARYKSYYNKSNAIIDYHDALASIGYLLLTSPKPIEHPLLKENSSGTSVILAIGSSKGFCGSYNDYIYQLVKVHVDMAKKLGKKLEIYVLDRKLNHLLNSHGIKPAKIYSGIKEVPSEEQIDDMAHEFVNKYMAGQLDYFGIVYMRFHSVSNQRAQTLTIMPLTELIDDLTTRAKIIWPWKSSFEDFYFSPSADGIIEGLAKMIIRSSIQNCFMDAALSEHAARMVAMKNATENAEEMIEELTAAYNHARQSQITGELLDIIGGTGVLE